VDIVVADVDKVNLIDLVVFEAAMALRASQKEKERLNGDEGVCRAKQDEKETLYEDDIEMNENLNAPEVVWDDLHISPVKPNLGKGRGGGKLRGKVKVATGKRVPRSTARRRGLLPNHSVRDNVRDKSVVSLADGFERETDLNLDDNVSLDDYYDDDNNGDQDGNEDALNGYDSEGDDSGDEVENRDIDLIVNDDWDPEAVKKWEDENDQQQKRIYKKGEMYSKEEFGKITIKPWQLFTDKQHLRDVVRDYCIQTGFSIIMQKANNLKWTVLCSDESCGWRLHACSCLGYCSEDEESWMFFMHHLKKLLEPARRGDQWCIVSDRQKGIDNTLSRLWPAAGRRYCCKHLSQNFKSKFNGPKMWNLFWLACGAYSEFTFRKAMEAFQKTNPAARIWNKKSDNGEVGFKEGSIIWSRNQAYYNMEQWPEIDLPLIQPPKMKRGVGRPCRNRRRGVEEQRKGKEARLLFVLYANKRVTTRTLAKEG
ncbi:Transposase for insertion sequence element IS905, partial [Bienertia sinuspersici]